MVEASLGTSWTEFTFPWAAGKLALAPNLFSAPGATARLNMMPLLVCIRSSPCLVCQFGHLNRRLELPESQDTPSSLHLCGSTHITLIRLPRSPPANPVPLSQAHPGTPPLLPSPYLGRFSKPLFRLLLFSLFIPFLDNPVHSLGFNPHAEVSQICNPGKSFLAPLLQYSRNHSTPTRPDFLLF